MRLGVYLCLSAAMACGKAALGQTIQLPSIHQFSVDTTVVVPDSGQGFAAGNKRRSSSTRRIGGLPPQQALGIDRQAAGVAVTAQIHDPQRAEAALADEARARRGGDAVSQTPRQSDLALRSDDPGLMSLAEIQRRRAQQSAAADRESQAWMVKAREAQAAGKLSLSAGYYRAASKPASAGLKRQIDAELRRFRADRIGLDLRGDGFHAEGLRELRDRNDHGL